MIRKIVKLNRASALIIPQELLRQVEANLNRKLEVVDIDVEGNSFVVTPMVRRVQ